MADLKALVQRLYTEVFNEGNLATVDELVDESFVEHEEFPGVTPDKAGLAAFVAATRTAFPDLSFETEAIVTDGDEVWAQVTMRGTHAGEFLGIPATGRSIAVPAVDRIRFVDGKLVEHWGVMDRFVMMQQLGLVPDAP